LSAWASPPRENYTPAWQSRTTAPLPATFMDGSPNMTVKLSKSLIIVEQGSTSARFYLSPKGTGIVMVLPPDARSRETYNTENHNYVNADPAESVASKGKGELEGGDESVSLLETGESRLFLTDDQIILLATA
jgi:hypothetical protein